ncbi:unnamed protein product [Spirodela intermedia]|uniref:Cytochrome b561 domain-containing protein n=1 Tax=Spirodela intermedia TaxID=51605 RepID=A0A7I8JSL8_SPIIN|nr:unnamed protein product [Spirodela intermedia]CAA6673114.1 unnamed protein product [Spirodela intermedia]
MASPPVVRFPIVFLIRLFGAAAAAMVIAWVVRFRGGMALFSDNKDLIFNVHPVLMVIGFILVYGEELQEGGAPLCSVPCALLGVVGVWAAIKFHNEKGIDNFYSLHSWLGLASLISFSIQGLPPSMACVLGVYIYALGIATAVTGILEKATFLQSNREISRYSSEAFLVNLLGILLVVLGGFVVLAVITPRLARAARHSGTVPTRHRQLHFLLFAGIILMVDQFPIPMISSST